MPREARTPNATRSMRAPARRAKPSAETCQRSTVRSTGRSTPRTVSVPATTGGSTRSETKVISGCAAVSRNFAARTCSSRLAFPVWKLPASMTARTRDSRSGSATSTVPEPMANVPRTGTSPKTDLMVNVTAERPVSIG